MKRQQRRAAAGVAVRAVLCALVGAVVVAACSKPPAPAPIGAAPTKRTASPEPSTPPAPRAVGKDLALPPSRDVAAVLRRQSDGSAPLGATSASALSFSFARDHFEFRDLTGAAMPYALGRVVDKQDTSAHDDDGVRMQRIGDTLYEHPNFQAGYGIVNLESYRLTGDRFYLERAEAQAQRLVDRRVASRGAWFYPYTFDFRLHGNPDETMRAPWYSGLAQGKALSLFTRMYEVTGEKRWREAADRTFASFVNLPGPLGAPWVSRVDAEGLLWLVEYPLDVPERSDHVFNGHLSAIFGLWDYYRVARTPAALAMYDGAITTMKRYTSVLRVAGKASLYCVPHRTPASNGYHSLHVSQFVHLWLMTGRIEFVHLADALRDDNPGAVLRAAHVVDLASGTHVGYTFDLATGAILTTQRVKVPESTSTTLRRMRITGRGIYYRLASGPLVDHWIPENAGQAMVRGPVAEVAYKSRRRATFESGRTYVGHTYDEAGNTVGTRRTSSATESVAEFDKTAWVAGARAARMVTGPFAGYWVSTADLHLD